MGILRHFRVLGVAALASACVVPAHADDPRDPTMTPEAIARDRATIRRLNREQLNYVQRRDAAYAEGWRQHDDARRGSTDQSYPAGQRNYAGMHADYARERRRYEAKMRQWRQDVAACRAGHYDRCDQR